MENSILNVEVSCFANYMTAHDPKTINLLKWLKSAKYEKEVIHIRSIEDKGERDKLKEILPAITPGGIYSYRVTDRLIRFSGLMQLDIDHYHNPHIKNLYDLKKLVCRLPYVAYCGTSVSGRGYWLLIPIQDQDQYLAHFDALERDWKDIVKIVIDPSRKDIAGLRGYSFDPEAYYNHDAIAYTKVIAKAKEKTTSQLPIVNPSQEVFSHVQQIVESYGISFIEGHRHNYLVKLCQYLNRFGVSQEETENWIFSNLPITPQEIKSNCITHPFEMGKSEFGKYQTVFIPFEEILDYNEKSYRIKQEGWYFYIPKSRIYDVKENGCLTQRFIAESGDLQGKTMKFEIHDFFPNSGIITELDQIEIPEIIPEIHPVPSNQKTKDLSSIPKLPMFTKNLNKTENWETEIEELEYFFTTHSLQPNHIKINNYMNITDLNLFVESHLSTVKSFSGEIRFKPYLNRLQNLKQFIQSQIPS